VTEATAALEFGPFAANGAKRKILGGAPHENSAALSRYVNAVWRSLPSGIEFLSASSAVVELTRYRIRAREARDGSRLPRPLGTLRGMRTAHMRAVLELAVPVFSRPARGEVVWFFSGKRIRLTPTAANREFIFSYPLPVAPAARDDFSYLSHLIAELLDTVDACGPTGNYVRPAKFDLDGIRRYLPLYGSSPRTDLGERTEVRSELRLQPLHSVASTTPFIVSIARHFSLLCRSVAFYDEDGTLDVTGMSLRRNADWAVPSSGHPSEVYEYLARVCNVSCTFCYLYGNPDSMAIARGTRVAPAEELKTRLDHYDPTRKVALFKAQWEINEFLVDPRLAVVLRGLRQKTDRPFFFITNGSPLTQDVVKLLAEVAPVDIVVSVNDIDPGNRRLVMREKGKQTQTALDALELLSEHRIPFGVSLAAFPQFGLAGMERTIRAVQAAGAAFVRVNLPGYTKTMPAGPDFDSDERWREVVGFVRELRPTLQVPVTTIPSAFEENIVSPQAGSCANVIGAIPGSPAARAGLKPYDVVIAVDDFAVENRSQMLHLLLLMRRRFRARVRRSGIVIDLDIDPNDGGEYPYARPVFGKYLFPLGVVASPSLGEFDFERLDAELEGAGHPLVVTSPLMAEEARRLCARHLPHRVAQISWCIATNDYLGGNIRVMDMCSVSDFEQAVAKHITFHRIRRPVDRVVMPASAFNEAGRDIAGVHWRDLQDAIGVEVRLLPMQQSLF
jgi:uncharacterized Fe-S cluster-containing radical SAM superfamily protein